MALKLTLSHDHYCPNCGDNNRIYEITQDYEDNMKGPEYFCDSCQKGFDISIWPKSRCRNERAALKKMIETNKVNREADEKQNP